MARKPKPIRAKSLAELYHAIYLAEGRVRVAGESRADYVRLNYDVIYDKETGKLVATKRDPNLPPPPTLIEKWKRMHLC